MSGGLSLSLGLGLAANTGGGDFYVDDLGVPLSFYIDDLGHPLSFYTDDLGRRL